ncbi:MAG: ABC transporter permease [Roseburia sp.]|nr:ABC transporter permease [Roseburia sp.]
MKKKKTLAISPYKIIVPVGTIFITLFICTFMIKAMDLSPIEALKGLLVGSFGSISAVTETMVKMTPLIFTGLSYAIAYRCGLTNLGMEGQLYIGALCATAVGVYLKEIPSAIHIPLCLIAAFIGGGIWGMLAGLLKVKFGASEIITTVMLNTIATNFIAYMVAGPMIEPPGVNQQTAAVEASAELPRLYSDYRVHLGFLIAIGFVFAFWIFLWKSKKGYEVRVSGFNRDAAKYSGIKTDRNIVLVMFLAGGLAGLAGACEILGVQKRMVPTISPGYGSDGIAVSLIGNNSPIGVVIGALLFGALRAGSNKMQILAKVPTSMISIIQALVIIAVVSSYFVMHKLDAYQLKKNTLKMLEIEEKRKKESAKE